MPPVFAASASCTVGADCSLSNAGPVPRLILIRAQHAASHICRKYTANVCDKSSTHVQKVDKRRARKAQLALAHIRPDVATCEPRKLRTPSSALLERKEPI